MRVIVTLLQVILTLSLANTAFAVANFYCPKGEDSFLKDRELANCNDDKLPEKTPTNSVHLFDIRKSYNPQNLIVIFSRVTSDCKFPETNHNQDLIDLYWRMNEGSAGVCLKESAVKDRIRTKLKIHSVSNDRTQLTVSLDDLDKVRHDLPDRAASVTLAVDPKTKNCAATVSFALAGEGKRMNLWCVHAEPVLWLGFPAPVEEVEALTLVGANNEGDEVRKRFQR